MLRLLKPQSRVSKTMNHHVTGALCYYSRRLHPKLYTCMRHTHLIVMGIHTLLIFLSPFPLDPSLHSSKLTRADSTSSPDVSALALNYCTVYARGTLGIIGNSRTQTTVLQQLSRLRCAIPIRIGLEEACQYDSTVCHKFHQHTLFFRPRLRHQAPRDATARFDTSRHRTFTSCDNH